MNRSILAVIIVIGAGMVGIAYVIGINSQMQDSQTLPVSGDRNRIISQEICTEPTYPRVRINPDGTSRQITVHSSGQCGTISVDESTGIKSFLEYSTKSSVENDVRSIEEYVLVYTNAKRTAQNTFELKSDNENGAVQTYQYTTLPSLALDEGLSEIARAHSQDMAARGFYDHENPDGQSPTDRADAAGYSCEKTVGMWIYSGISENIHQVYNHDYYYYELQNETYYKWLSDREIASLLVEDWWSSPGHRDNILDETHDRIGIGVAITDSGEVYATQNFC